MIQVFRYGIDISRHHLKGIYVVMVGQIRKPSLESEERSSPSTSRQAQVICTLREGPVDECEDWNDTGEGKAPSGNCPITLTYRGQKTTLRPWDPSRCPLAAAIHNQLIHFPIRPKSNVFAIHCSLQSLSHISDTLGPLGRVIGVCSRDPQKQPKPETVHRFLKRHPNTTLIFEDVEEATLERYERLLSLPDDSRYAFLMALHPRLGENSPARLLKEDAPKLCKRIFDFLVCTTPAHIKSLVLWPWTGDAKDKDWGEDADQFDKVPRHVQEIVMNHTNILQRWRRPRRSGEKKHSEGENSDSHERIWVFLDIRTDTSSGGNLDMKLVNELAKLGLLAKEQLALTPWFPNHALLLLQYALHRDERQAISRESYKVPGSAEGKERRLVKEGRSKEKSHRPPSALSMPVPSFGTTKNTLGPVGAPSKPPSTSSSGAGVPRAAASSGGCGFSDLSPAYLHDPASGLQQSQLLGKGGYAGLGGQGHSQWSALDGAPPGLGPSLLQGAGGGVQNWLGAEEQSQQELLSYLQVRQQAAQGLQFGASQQAAAQLQWQQQVAMLQGGLGGPSGPAGLGGKGTGTGLMGKGGGSMSNWPPPPGHPGAGPMNGLPSQLSNFGLREDQLNRAMNL